MAWYLGSTKVGSMYLGSTKIGQAYLGSTLVYSSSGPAPTPAIPAGIIEVFAGDTVPTGYLLCDGSAVDRTTYATLFAVIGTTYGAGDGSTTFNLPDLSGKTALGSSGTHALASIGGAATVTLQGTNLPSHTHSVPKHGHADTIAAKTPSLAHTISTQPAFKYTAPSTSNCSSGSKAVCASHSTDQTATRATNVAITAHAATACTMSGSVTAKAAFNSNSTTGGGAAHDNMQPYLAVNYIISTGA